MTATIIPWILFTLFVIAALFVDLVYLHREDKEVSIKNSLFFTVVWIAAAMVFCAGIYFVRGGEPALQFLTGYLIEKSLSVDNLFVFVLIFTHFGVPPVFQHKVLFWGILGAIVMRLAFIFGGIALINTFHWVIYVFGGFLVFTGGKLAMSKAVKMDPEKSVALKMFRKIMPLDHSLHGGSFFVRRGGRAYATPLFVALILIETSDVIFALDSIPAILAITLDPFIVYTSNIFAILGLRSLFFALAGVMKMFRYLHYGLSVILIFLGVKMLLSDFYHIPATHSLMFIAAVLTTFGMASAMAPSRSKERR